MANTVNNVTFGKPKISGSIYRALLVDGLEIPTDATTALGTGFKCLGYVSDDGVRHNMSNSDDGIKAWGGDTVLITDDTRTDSFQFKLLEVMNEDVLKAVYVDDNVTVTDASGSKKIAIASNSDVQPDCCWVIDMVMRGDNPKRIVIPKGKITEIGEIVYKDDEGVGYDITINGKADAAGNTHYEYMSLSTAE